jgi:hypothetical protein
MKSGREELKKKACFCPDAKSSKKRPVFVRSRVTQGAAADSTKRA